MSALLTKAFEKWVAECTANNQPAKPDAIVFALMEREPSRDDGAIPSEKITYTVNELSYGQIDSNNIVCSAVVPDNCEFIYDWICLIHQASNTLCGVIKTPVRQKLTGESLIRNFTITYSGISQAAQITVPPQSWQLDISAELKKMLRSDNHLSEIAAEGEKAQQESRSNLGLKSAAARDVQADIYDSTKGRVSLPGAYGYGMTDSGSTAIIANDMATVAKTAHNLHPGRYYTFSTRTEETTGITEIIWLDNGWGDKISQTATKLVLFFGKDGRILASIRGEDRSTPVVWTNLTPQLGNAAGKDAQENIYDRATGRLAIPGMFGFGKVFGREDRVEFKTHSALLEWAKTAMPGRYHCYGDIKDLIPGLSQIYGIIEVIWPYDSTESAAESASKTLIYYTARNVYINVYTVTTNGGTLAGWENMRVDEYSLKRLINAKAPLSSPVLTGTPRTPTPPDDATGTEIANAEFVRKLLAGLVGSSPEALDTLNELAAALGNDPNFATTVTNTLAGKQPVSEVLTSLADLTTASNKLAYFSDKNVMALANLTAVGRVLIGQNSKSEVLEYLGLKNAAAIEPQSDIYDRTEGRLALPGAFGFGAIFRASKSFSSSNGPTEFLEWVKNTNPGKYAVVQYGSVNRHNPIIKGVVFTGIIDIKIPDTVASNASPYDQGKLVTFYGVNGEIYCNRFRTSSSGDNSFAGWRNWLLDTSDLIRPLLSTTGNSWGDPDVGGLIFAAYQGTEDGDRNIKVERGKFYPGSRLGPVGISAPYNSSGSYSSTPRFYVMGCVGHSLPGTYQALSGITNTYGSDAMLGLFLRIG